MLSFRSSQSLSEDSDPPRLQKQIAFDNPEQKTILDLTFSPYISEHELFHIIDRLATQINETYENTHTSSPPIILGVLNGAFIFLGDLAKRISIDCEFHFIKVSSYEGTNTSGKVTEVIGLTKDVEYRDILIVEDIVDTGLTIQKLTKILKEKNPRSIKVCTLLYKNHIVNDDIQDCMQDDTCCNNSMIDFIGKTIPDVFVVGYGLDYNNLGRNLDSIYAIEKI